MEDTDIKFKEARRQKTSGRRVRVNPRRSKEEKGEEATSLAAVGTLTREKNILLAALRVWELKHRIGE